MSSVPGRNRRLEAALGACLLGCLFFIAVGIFVKQSDVDMARFGMRGVAEQSTLQSRQGTKQETLLTALAPSGFKPFSESETYSTENLYEKIDGKAPLYIESGFEMLFTQRFVSKNDKSLLMEIYVFAMGTPRNAFSVYSVQRRPEGTLLPDMRFGYHTENGVYSARGKYYVELIGFAQSEQLLQAMLEVARNSRTVLPADKTAIPELALLPEKYVVPGTLRFCPAGTFGFAQLTNVFVWQCDLEGENLTAFLSKRSDSQNAAATAEAYRRFLVENGGAVKQTDTDSLRGKLLGCYDTTEVVLAKDESVIGVHEAESQDAAEKPALILLHRLAKLKEAPRDDRR